MVRTEQARAQGPSTKYSLPSLLTGRYYSSIAMGKVGFWREFLPENVTIAERLKIPQSTVRRQLSERYAWFGGPFTSAQVQLLRSIRGVHLTGDLIRFHPNPGLAQAVLGHPAAEGRRACDADL